jgi:long-chain acyl-CoA synthetase
MILTKIIETAARYPNTVAVQMKVGDRYQRYTYAQLIESIVSAAAALAGKGIRKGDRLVLLSENRPEWMIAYLSTVCLGAVIVPLDAQLTEKEIDLLLADSGARAVFVSSGTAHKLPRRQDLDILSFDPGIGRSFTDMMTSGGGAVLPPLPAAADLAAILYTSGTTGDPKGVMLSQGNLASNVASTMQLRIVKPGDNMLCILPLHHTYPAHTCMLLPFSSGATVTLLNSLKGPELTACMRETGVTIMLGVPQLFAALRRAIFDEIRKKPAVVRMIVRLLLGLNGLATKTVKANLGKVLFGKVHEKFGTSLRLLASGGARLEPDIFTDMTNLGFTMIEGYGLTETSPVCSFDPVERPKPGSIGIPVPDVELRIANPDDNGQGEIAVRGPNVMIGYYRKPEATAQVLKDGWFYTGDLGYRDRDGYFFVTGRSKEMIVLSTGKKIFPDELEKVYKQIPSIKELCLVQTERGIEAAVVPDFDYLRKMNIANSRETIAFELEDLARDLPPYKRITGLKIFKDGLPATRLGKLKRSLVRDLYLKSGERAEKPVAEIDTELLATPVGRKFLACLEPFSQKKNIVPDDNLELDLGLDSLARVELVVSMEKSFGISLPDSFGSEIFTVKEAVLKVQELTDSGTARAGEKVRLSWADILAQEPAPELREKLRLDHGAFCGGGRAFLGLLVKAVLKGYTRLSVRGLEYLPRTGPVILAPNHLSFADAPAIVASLPWRLGGQTFFLGATTYFGGAITSRIAKVVQVIPVDMDTRLQGALQLSAFVLRNNKVLCVFPEGSRSRDGRTKEFKKGVAIVARELNIPIIPVAIRGTYQVLAPGRAVPVPRKVSVTFGPPVRPDGRDYDGIMQELARAVKSLLNDHEK